MFCNADKCNTECPAHVINYDDERTECMLINAKLDAEEAKKLAYQAMKSALNKLPE